MVFCQNVVQLIPVFLHIDIHHHHAVLKKHPLIDGQHLPFLPIDHQGPGLHRVLHFRIHLTVPLPPPYLLLILKIYRPVGRGEIPVIPVQIQIYGLNVGIYLNNTVYHSLNISMINCIA